MQVSTEMTSMNKSAAEQPCYAAQTYASEQVIKHNGDAQVSIVI